MNVAVGSQELVQEGRRSPVSYYRGSIEAIDKFDLAVTALLSACTLVFGVAVVVKPSRLAGNRILAPAPQFDVSHEAHGMPADRNLLFGILAVQSGFCTGPQLVEAMNAWTLAKERPIGDILLERGHLKPNEHDLLAALVALQLEKQGGNVEKSLAELTPMPRLAAAMRQIGDKDVEQSLAALPASGDEDADRTRTHESCSTGESVRYRILRPHARGGAGRSLRRPGRRTRT